MLCSVDILYSYNLLFFYFETIFFSSFFPEKPQSFHFWVHSTPLGHHVYISKCWFQFCLPFFHFIIPIVHFDSSVALSPCSLSSCCIVAKTGPIGKVIVSAISTSHPEWIRGKQLLCCLCSFTFIWTADRTLTFSLLLLGSGATKHIALWWSDKSHL